VSAPVTGLREQKPERKRRIQPRVVARVVALVLVGFVSLVGCTSTVHPPQEVGDDGVPVWLIQDARHRGLILPGAGGQLVEYGYGEFAWYAEMKDAWYRAIPAALWPTTGTLGVRRLRARNSADLETELRGAALGEMRVARAAVDALNQRLAERFASGGEPTWNAIYGFEFVPDPDGYWCLFNCNDAVAVWLEELGCRVSWVPIRLGLEVAGTVP
jgi:hypothetical protein